MTDHLRIGRIPIAWEFSERVTEPRPTWHEAGRKRTRAPLTDAELEARWNPAKPYRRKSHTYRRYACVYKAQSGWYWRFRHKGGDYRQYGYATEDAAAVAYNLYVTERGFKRALLDVDNDDMEAAS